ncbi:hypothetical protein [Rhizobium sp. SG570]|uniref:hypothetical protein n=1 Tax=Rhizobium sp. SG570 TaxID=2587113 RepID=UPI00144502EF|nr:hypothetical protein [Rhizobium sp. SG570]NKJ34113.1 hypothetical protein [Rhizobium sp. SG570]
MTPAEAIASLDSALAAKGARVNVYRYTAAGGNPRPKTEAADVPAFVRAVSADQLVGTIDQTGLNIVLSPTMLADLLPLKKGDKLLIDGRERNVELVKPISMQTTLVRINLVVIG